MPTSDEQDYKKYLEYQDYLASAPDSGDVDIAKYLQGQEKYGGITGSLAAGALGAASSATFGLSTQALTKSGLVSPETIKGYEEANPISHATGEVAGVVGSLVLAPEVSLPGLVAKAGGRTAVKAAAMLPAERVISGAASAALGSAVEGAAYGLGHVIHEEALGDPAVNGEKILGEIGYGALAGGAFGAVLGGASSAIKKKFPAFMSSSTESASLENATTLVPAKEQKGIVAGLKQLKANANEIKLAAQELDAPVLESQISASKAIHDLDSLLINNPSTPIGIARQQLLQEGIDKAEQTALNAMGGTTQRSQAELGDALKEGLTRKITAENEPIAKLYETIKQTTDHIPVSDKAKEVISANIKKLENYKFSNSPERKIGNQLLQDFQNIKTVDDIKRYSTMLNKSLPPTASPGDRYAVGRIVEKLVDLEEASVVRAAEAMSKETKDPAVRKMVLGLIDERKTANTAFKTLRGKMEELGSVLGKKRIGGTADFLEFIDNMPVEKLASKLFAKKDSAFLKFFAKEFPEEMALVREYEKGRLLSMKNMFKDDRLNIGKLVSEVDSLAPEIKEVLFTADELRKLNAVKVYTEAIPKNMNPSGTAHAKEARDFLQKVFGSWKDAVAGAATGGALAGPLGAVAGGIGGAVAGAQTEVLRDYGIKKLIQAAVDANEKGGMDALISRLSTVERVVNNATNNLDYYAGRALKSSAKMIEGVKNVYLPMTYSEKMKSFDKIQADIQDKTKTADNFLETVTKSTEGLYEVAPMTSGSIQATLGAATEFLKSKLPSTDPLAPLSNKRVPSDAELSKFFRYYSVVENPYTVLKQVKDGTLNSEAMEAMSTVYPKLLGEMQEAVANKLTEQKNGGKDLPYQTKVMLSAFLGVDLIASITQQGIFANQMTYQMPSQKQDNIEMAGAMMKKPSQKGMESVTLAERSATGTQAVSQRKQTS